MKDSVKKITVAICAAAMSLMIAAGSAMASTARPQPDGSGETTTATMSTSSGQTGETDVNSANTQQNQVSSVVDTTQTAASANTERSYQTKLGGFLWFLLSVVVNFVISCWIGNRFYRLARKSNQSSAEIRALRKDIEEKFGSTLKDISEPALEVMNQNENYARSDEGLTMPDRQRKIEINDEEREIFRKWDAQRANSRAGARNTRPAEREEDFESDYDDYENEEERPARQSTRRNSYQPTRRSSGIRFDDDDEGYDEYDDEDYDDRRSYSGSRPSQMSERREKSTSNKVNKAKGRAKDFLSNVFPFDE